MTEIRCKQVMFFSKVDEEMFFVWAQKIPGIKEVYGELDEIVLSLSSPDVEDESLRELIALLYRFDLPLKQLAAFESSKNKEWFNNKNKFWYAGVFGKNG